MEYSAVENNQSDKLALRDALEDAIQRQLMCDVPMRCIAVWWS